MKKRMLLFAGASTLILVSFQNCSKVAFTSTPAVVEDTTTNTNGLSVSDASAETKMNIPVEFEVSHSNTPGDLVISFQAANPNHPMNGVIEVIDLKTFKLKYTPNFGFRGKEYVLATAIDKSGKEYKFNVTITVGNSLQELEPALAVRGMGCIQCHAQVASNIVTDFGYKNDYYFGQIPANSWWNSGGVYGDHANKFNTMAIPADKSVIVPQANLPGYIASATGKATLKDYVRGQLDASANANTRAAQVQEKKSVYIGAPTDSNIVNAFKFAAGERMKYFKNSDMSAELSGLKDEGTFFRNDGVMSCEGDLAIRGPLLLDNLQLSTKSGCRIYVIGSVFMYGSIIYFNNDAERNLQITSTKSISMGLGDAKKSGSFCEPNGRYAQDTANYGTSSLVNRYSSFWTIPGNYVRQSNNPKAFGDSILAEANVIQAKAGILYDAACRPEGRNVSFERILLNAPMVHSRYEGNVSGTIIAEISIMSLGMFKFSFDQVFKQVPVFPFLDKKIYLDVED